MHILHVTECHRHPKLPDGSRGIAYTIQSTCGHETHCCGDWDFTPALELGSYRLELDEQHGTLSLLDRVDTDVVLDRTVATSR